jgi:hypothetical protein
MALTEYGENVITLLTAQEAEELDASDIASEIALCEAIKARNEPGLPHDAFMVSLAS